MQRLTRFNTSRRGVMRSLAAGSLLFPGIVSQLLADDAGSTQPGDPTTMNRTPFFRWNV